MHRLDTTTLVGIAVVLVIMGGLIAALAANTEERDALTITNFEECAAAGYPIMESYPEQCATPDGRTFQRDISSEDSLNTRVADGCALAGCSSELCLDASEAADVFTTCEYREEYACYSAYGRCERQASGRCGWTDTPELAQCVDAATSPPATIPPPPPTSPTPGKERLDTGDAPATAY